MTFAGVPLPLVEALLAIRSRGRPLFAHTHMGKVIQGQLLTEKDFEGPTLVGGDDIPDEQPSTSKVHETRKLTPVRIHRLVTAGSNSTPFTGTFHDTGAS